jgi:hypothetical protein
MPYSTIFLNALVPVVGRDGVCIPLSRLIDGVWHTRHELQGWTDSSCAERSTMLSLQEPGAVRQYTSSQEALSLTRLRSSGKIYTVEQVKAGAGS